MIKVELGFNQRLVQCMLHSSGFKCYIPRLVHNSSKAIEIDGYGFVKSS